MDEDRMSEAYFEWMYHLVRDGKKGKSWRKLLRFLHESEFVYTLVMDGNRAEDGIDLRYRFAYESGFDTHLIAGHLDGRPCSVLEMLMALSIRCEEHIMDDPTIGDRTGKWFWEMIVSLGLSSMNDARFHRTDAEAIITRFLRREYEQDGRGGLFTVEGCPQDLRTVEIWYQMMWYLDSII